jgi:hypothetical protein
MHPGHPRRFPLGAGVRLVITSRAMKGVMPEGPEPCDSDSVPVGRLPA